MGCTSEKSIPIGIIKSDSNIIDTEINIDLHDIEKQGESKHPQIEEQNLENVENEENNYYNYKLDDLISVNDSKMKVKRIENFDDDNDESDNESSNEGNEDNNSIENKNQENIEDKIDEKENKIPNNNQNNDNDIKINMDKNNDDNKPEDKKPPNIEKLKKKGKEKIEINLFN